MKNESETREMNDMQSGKSHKSVPFFCFISDELTRLWNLNHDNMDACKSESRSDKVHLKFDSHFDTFISFILFGLLFLHREFIPSLDDFFSEAIEQADPANMVEDEYK